jgi:hypothetical protein
VPLALCGGSIGFATGASPVSFIQIPYAGRTFLACMESEWPFGDLQDSLDDYWHPGWRPRVWRTHRLRRGENEFAGWFVMEERAAERFLNALSAIIRNGRENLPDSLELPRVDPVGFGIGGEDAEPTLPESEYTYALYRDGLALLGSPPPRRIARHRAWFPKDGIRAD